MSTIHIRPGEGRHYPMIDGDHIAKDAVQDAGRAFEVFEVVAPAAPMAPHSLGAILSVTQRHGVSLTGA